MVVTYVLPEEGDGQSDVYRAVGCRREAVHGGQVDYFDTKPPALGLRVAPSGRKTWFIMYRSGGRLRRLTLGTYPVLSLADAREQALAPVIPWPRG